MIFDTHCHLNSPELYEKIDEVLNNAKAKGVNFFMIVGWDKESSFLAKQISDQNDNIYAAVGFHPCDINNVSEEDYKETIELAKNPNVKAIGEIGLDYYWEKSKEQQEKQKQWFIKQINDANMLNKPIIVHCRDAIGDCLEILKSHKPKCGGIMHCYSGSVETMREIINLGMMIGFGGPLTFKNSKTPKEVCAVTPLEKIVVETDCPYLAPHPLRGSVNEPANITLVVDEIARIKNISVEEVKKAVFDNALRVFNV